MIAAVLSILFGGLAILGVVIGWRWYDGQTWRESLVALRLQFPRGLKADELSAWLGMLSTLRVAMALEIVATRQDIHHYLLVPKTRQAEVLAGTRSVLPGVRLEDAPGYLTGMLPTWQAACELRITHLSHQLAADRAETTAAAFLGSLGQLGQREAVMVQWLLIGTATPGPRMPNDPARELARAEKAKHGQPLLQAVGRVAVQTAMQGRANALLSRIAGTLRLLDAPGVAVVRRSVPSRLVVRRLMDRALPLTAWPIAINVREAAGLVGVPLGQGVSIPGLVLGRSRQLPPGQVPSRGGTALAVSNYPGRAGQPLVLKPNDRLHHLYVVGPTGVGKSNLLAQMAIGDAARGAGLALIDPKGDLVETVLERLPDAATERVIVLDPSQTDAPVGFNPLHVKGADEHARELAADRVLHIFKDLYRANWGPRSDDLLRAALHTLVSIPAPNGQAFTICEVPELLTRPALRRYAVSRTQLPEALKVYWAGFDALSEAEQLQHTAPVMNKLRAFTMRTATRLMLGQSSGIDLDEVMRQRRLLLVSLAKGKLGIETATLTGSLLMVALWQAVLGRANVPPERRRPFFLFLDEFQDVVRLSDSLPDLLAQARGLGVGAVLANQYLAQLPESVRAAVLGTVRSQAAFQVEYDDARLLERRFAPSLSADDLMGLGRFEIALRPSVDGQTLAPVTGATLPLGEPVRDRDELARLARERWGRARADVEAAPGAGGSRRQRTRPARAGLPEEAVMRGVAIGVALASSASARSDLANGVSERITTGKLLTSSRLLSRAAGPGRVRARHVERLRESLSGRDWAVIHDVARLRLTTGKQLERLHFAELTGASRSVVRRRVLGRLVQERVLATLERRIGGVRAGSDGLVYYLDTAGQRLLATDGPVRRMQPPGERYVRHVLAVAGVYVDLTARAREGGLRLDRFEAEPASWWPDGRGGWLKPDGCVRVSRSDHFDSWWLEVDLATEHLPTLKRKLTVYVDFYMRGQLGPDRVMPLVLVTVPDTKRLSEIDRLICQLPSLAGELFTVVLHNDAGNVIMRRLSQP